MKHEVDLTKSGWMKDERLKESFYVTIRGANNDSRRTERVAAWDFAGAERIALVDCNLTNDEEIISIERDYKV